MSDERSKPESYWKERLTPEQYRVLREAGTEPPFSGTYYDCKEPGIYKCLGCGQPLFTSETKYESGSGWPSFWQPIDLDRLELRQDNSHGMTRTEVLCKNCGSHLGHLFDDGPQPTRQRYCINSVALDFEKEETKD